ncbi:MAG: thiamine pyrophosphokinase [Mycobacteriaceae bacterium]|nr:thiamine pyrophosphokinase [Mycobacteriaceae bacterium]
MRMPALLSRTADPLPGIVGAARVDRNTARLLRRIRPGEVAVLDQYELDRITADELLRAGVSAVVNASPSMSGRYPNLGPSLLVSGGVTLVDTGKGVFKKVKDGARIRVHDGSVYAGERMLAEGVELDAETVAMRLLEARNGLSAHLETFSGNMIDLIRNEGPLLLDGVGVPDVAVALAGRHVVVVGEGAGHRSDLKKLKPFLREYAPILVGVDAGADSLMRAGYPPDLIVGDPDKISAAALKSGAEVVLPADEQGSAPGAARIQELGLGAVTFPASAAAMDLALLLVHHHGAALIVSVGASVSLDDFVDRAGAEVCPAAFLTRLKVGSAVVDAKAVSTLYSGGVSSGVVALTALAGLLAISVAVLATDVGPQLLGWVLAGWHRAVAEARAYLH